MKIGVTVTEDFTEKVNKILASFKRDVVLVGIPQDHTQRTDANHTTINNATILAINEFGSPLNNIPPRPVMKLGIKNCQKEVADAFKEAVQKSFAEGINALPTYYNRAGIIASNSIKKVINSQEGIKPPKESTLKARKYINKGGFKGTKALLVTGQLRNAITYVVKANG
jgi:LmbE family N-acetylglucosaminyl deacetylase